MKVIRCQSHKLEEKVQKWEKEMMKKENLESLSILNTSVAMCLDKTGTMYTTCIITYRCTWHRN